MSKENENIEVEFESEEAYWREQLINSTKAYYQSKVITEVHRQIMELAKENLKGKL